MEQGLNDLFASLPVPRRNRKTIERELRTHVEDSVLELTHAGWSPEAAQRESIRRLGDPAEIADAFRHVYRPSRRRRVGVAIGLAGVMLLGVYGGGSLASATSAHPQDPPTHATTTSSTYHHGHR